jgi:hypothetical protein
MACIVQWNCRGLRANYNELLLLMQSYQHVALCLQELMIPESYNFCNRQYVMYSCLPPVTNSKPNGGAEILVHKSIPHHKVILVNTRLQAVACRISTPRPITLCSVYLPPSSNWSHTDLLDLVTQLPAPVMFVGDFNAHNSLWGCPPIDNKGLEVADFILQSNLCLMNNKTPTYIHPSNRYWQFH